MSQSLHVKRISEMAILISLAIVIQVIMQPFFTMPQGGSVTVAMLPLVILAYRHGLVSGIASGLIFGLLNWILSGMPQWGWWSFIVDYQLAFGAFGFSALVFKINRKSLFVFVLGITVAGLLRFAAHYLSGLLLFGEYAPEGVHPAWYSLTYNISYMAPTILLSIIIGAFIWHRIEAILTEDLLNDNLF